MVDLTSNNSIQHHSITLPAFDIVIYTDASTQGWEAQCNGILTGGHWTPQESRKHINVLELKAAVLAIKSFLRTQPWKPLHINLQMDNSIADAYVNKRGGPSQRVETTKSAVVMIRHGRHVHSQ